MVELIGRPCRVLSLVRQNVDKQAWIIALVAIALIAAFGDALVSFFLRMIGLSERRPPPTPGGLLEMMARDLASGEPYRVERATAAMLRIPGPGPVPYLTGLLRHQRGEVARQAAYILYQRQDPEGLDPLYQYLAENGG
jgi:hypothetical protein